MERSPLFELQRRMGASFGEAFGWELPCAFSNALEEYEAATRGVALLDRTYTGRLKATGKDALDLINRLSTNKLEDLSQGQGMSTVLTSNKARILDFFVVLRLDEHLLLLTSPQNRQKVAEWIDRYTFLEEALVEDITDTTVMLSLVGPKAPDLLKELAGKGLEDLSLSHWTNASIDDVDVTVIRTDCAGVTGYDLVIPAKDGERVWEAILQEGSDLGVKPIGMETLDIIRVEHGVPFYGRELSEKINPLEANLRHSISFNKGCYIGQEVVTRLDTYKKVQKHLMGLVVESDTVAKPDAKLMVDGKEAGFITSAVQSPALGKPIALAYIRSAHARAGVKIGVASEEGEVIAEVVELPFNS